VKIVFEDTGECRRLVLTRVLEDGADARAPLVPAAIDGQRVVIECSGSSGYIQDGPSALRNRVFLIDSQ
jgi:hypothetical protein